MGQQYSAPQDGVKLRVIGAGLPRTGTASFSRALEILLDGPVYHGGTQIMLGPEYEIKGWIKLLSQWPARDERTRLANLELIRSRTDGFVAITDGPGCNLVPELLELYPDAKVICTVRNPSSWAESMAGVDGASTKSFLRIVLFPVPSMRYFVDYVNGIIDMWQALYGDVEHRQQIWNRHMERLKETVPPERLVFFEVKDGWAPLCKALDLPVPENVPFPNINDGKSMQEFAQKQVLRGITRWAVIFATLGISVAVVARRLA